MANADSQRIRSAADPRSESAVPSADAGSSSTLEKGKPIHPRAPPPYAVPSVFTSTPKRRSCWFRFFYWTLSIVVLLLILIGVAIGVIFLVFNPMFPRYSVDSLRLTDLRLNPDQTLYTRFDVKITANNPNKKIGMYYKKGGSISVWFQGTNLCDGPLPKFYQGHRNVTTLDMTITGHRASGSTVLSALQLRQQTGNIALDLTVGAPVEVELGTWKLGKLTVLANCSLVVDSLSTNSPISIKENECNYSSKI